MSANTYRAHLAKSLESKAKMNAVQIATILSRFDKAVSTVSPEVAFRQLHSDYSTGSTEEAVAGVAEEIHKALEAANQHKISTSPVVRIREYIDRYKKNVGKISIEVCGIEDEKLMPHQRAAVLESREQRENVRHPVMPKFVYSSTANYRNNNFPVVVEWSL